MKPKLFLLTLISIVAVSCASLPVTEVKNEESAMIFGFMDVTELAGYVNFMSFMKYPPQTKPYFGTPTDVKVHVYKDGLFFAENVEPGEYWFAQFHTNDKKVYEVTWQPTEKDLFTVKSGQLRYVGSTKCVIEKKPGILLPTKGKFSLQPVESPTEKELLLQILEKVRGTGWEAKVDQRLSKL